MAVNKPIYHNINNPNFNKLIQAFKSLLGIKNIVSNIKDASLDDNNKVEKIYLYDGKKIDMDAIKLDDMTSYFVKYMHDNRKLKDFTQPNAVDAVFVTNDNEWFLIEFKNSPIIKNKNNEEQINSTVLTSIRQKMFGSLWFLFSLNSFTNINLFNNNDVTEFARNHITYIVIISREKNPDEYRRIFQSTNNLYTPDYLKKYVGYYFKDVYMMTEKELPRFIQKIKL